ncbi:uncharacterized protein LOC116619981 [Nematostella vectensis]|uniref:uncharacterized protein LOC116619981 n=1 Tax=Nematostella vectensis TaxID=45351 RepID=UPI002076D9FF|nr:uncharacterized protein LOC116619981 [Nematostella vectensis]
MSCRVDMKNVRCGIYSSFQFIFILTVLSFLGPRIAYSHKRTNLIADFSNETVVSRIAFGSCNIQYKPQPLWKHIQKQSPEVFIWLGDAVYADIKVAPFIWMPAPIAQVASKFNQQKNNPDYKNFLSSGVQVLGVWDDHDYGIDRGGKHHRDRLQSQGVFLDFLDEPVDSLRRQREGVYASYSYGTGDKTVKIILLDTRSHLKRGSDCDILGDEQWAWLERQLNDTATVTLIGTGIQVLSDLPITDKWLTCPNSYDRLLWMLQRLPRVFLLSGDVHFGEFQCLNSTSTGYPLYEVTSSGMTSVCVSFISKEFCYWLLTKVGVSSLRTHDVITEINYGMVNIDWDASPVEVSLEVRGPQGAHLQQVIPLSDLELSRDAPRCPPASAQAPAVTRIGFFGALYILVAFILLFILRILIKFLKLVLVRIVLPILGIGITSPAFHPTNGKIKSE